MAGHRSRRHERRRAARGSGGVNLISMMDVLTVLLLFLLKSYSTGEVMVPAPGVRLPVSTADQPPASSVVVAIDKDEIMVGGERVASLSAALSSHELEIAPLAQRLNQERRQQEAIAHLQGKKEADRRATIQGDRDIEFRALAKVMFTLHRSGYESIALAVLQKT